MSRLILSLTVLPVLGFLIPAAPIPKHLAGAKYYYPTTVGAKWVYKEGERGWTREWAEVITAVEEQDDGKVVTVKRVGNDGVEVESLKVAVSGQGVFRLESMGHKDAPPICWLKLPTKPGAVWEYAWPQGPTERTRTFAPELVEVPAGTYRAIPIEVEISWGPDRPPGVSSGLGSSGVRVIRWFAPGVGIVKQRGSNYEQVLMSFTPGV